MEVDSNPRGGDHPGILARAAAGFFGFVSGVVRNARTFHPDGRTFRGTVRALSPADGRLAHAAMRLEGAAVLRIGMGMLKTGMPRWIADHVPDAPSIAIRVFTASTPDELRLQRRPDEDLDLLCTAGGDRLWKLILNLLLGGRMYGLKRFDYFANIYSADVPYRLDEAQVDVWVRLVPDPTGFASHASENSVSREERLTDAVARHATLKLEVRPVGSPHESFVPVAEVRLEAEVAIDQEALHFDPVAGRGFTPHGFLTGLRTHVYPASARSRPSTRMERARRDHETLLSRLARFLHRR